MTSLDRLYPDVVRAGGLTEWLQSLVKVSVDSRRHDIPGAAWAASVTTHSPQHRQTAVMVGSEERVFVIEACIAQAHLGTGSVAEPNLVAGWIDDFHSGIEVEAVVERHPFLQLSNQGKAYLSRSEVEWWWQHLLNPPAGDIASLPRLRDLIEAAAAEPRLRQLLPFTSHDDLSFSRCTRYPFSDDLPWIRSYAAGAAHDPGGDYRYEVSLPGQPKPHRTTNTAAEAVAAAASMLPAGCGPATAGTADDLD